MLNGEVVQETLEKQLVSDGDALQVHYVHSAFNLVASLLLVVMPEATSSVLATILAMPCATFVAMPEVSCDQDGLRP